jgi:hypothetical protein
MGHPLSSVTGRKSKAMLILQSYDSINFEQENFEKLFNLFLNDFVSALDGKTHVRRTLLDGCRIAGLIDLACTSACTSQPVAVNSQ